ncbi:MAG: esterase-like activity of phytase family protein [Cellvibrionaceae bacterium]
MKKQKLQNTLKSVVSISACLCSTLTMADSFQRISSWSTIHNLPKSVEAKTETSAEIITATADGNTLIYSDSPLEGIGFVDIKKPESPKAAGFLKLKGEPTSVSAVGKYALVGVNTSESYTKPSGFIAAISIKNQKITTQCDLGGQPDSVAVSPDKKYVAIAIENERDEDLNDGLIPQLPAGNLVIFSLKKGQVICETRKTVSLTGLADIAPSDPEPEFVDFNKNNEIVISLQENNHYVVVDANTGKVNSHFSAGSTDLVGLDLKKDRAFFFNQEQLNRKREPDAVKWIDNDRFVAANEGDYEGGSRGFTIYHKNGKVLFESGLDLEHRVIMAGHYPDKRSSKKGSEPEGIEVATFGNTTYLFILVERAGVVGVYKDTGAEPEFVQLLPAGIGPEGAVAIPKRNLLVVANEKDLIEDKGPRSYIMLYSLTKNKPAYPHIESIKKEGKPIGWGALSGLVADENKENILYAVNDSFYRSQPTIFTIDTAQSPAKIINATHIKREGYAAQKMDMEGIANDGKGGFWIASEGKTKSLVPHAIYNINAKGKIKKEIPFPSELLAVEKRFGSEGITKIGDTLWIAIQREWKDDPEGLVKLVAYNTKTKEWGAVRYPLEKPVKNGWVGLSEIVAYGDFAYIIERDNKFDDEAKVKRLYKVAISELKPAKLGSTLPVVKKTLAHDFIPNLKASNGYVLDKIEGFAITKNGEGFAVTDNDGVDDSSGETRFFSIGSVK